MSDEIRDDSGKFAPGNELAIRDSDRARELQALGVAKRRENGVRAAMEALAEGESGETLASRVYGGWKSVAEAQKRLALDTTKGHASTRAAEFLGKAADLLPKDSGVRMKDGDKSIAASSPEELRELLQVIQQERDRRNA